MKNKDMSIVIVGHVDHGKSTLIGRLLYDTDSLPAGKIEEIKQYCELKGKDIEFAYVMDALQEEQEQNITIDIAQIFFKTKNRQYVIIDAPGHREFTKNMITGASQAEAAILIVDANEGVQEQTKRHSYVLSLLGLKQVIVVVNKMDLIDYDEGKFLDIRNKVVSLLKQLDISPLHVIPISAKTGDNLSKKSDEMSWYDGPIFLDALDTLKHKANLYDFSFRLPIQDVYKIKDKRIFVGRVESGTVSRGQKITVLPSMEESELASIEVFLENNKAKAYAGECIGITTKDSLFIDRGHIICPLDNQPKVVNQVGGSVFWMSKDPLKKSDIVLFKCATQAVAGTVEEIKKRIDSATLEVLEENAEEIKNREVGEVSISFDREIVIDDFNKTPELGRFVIERNQDIVGGGIIIS